MGTPIDCDTPLFVQGVDCHICDGLLWAEGKTPKFVWIVFHGIFPCPLLPWQIPNDKPIKLTQISEYPCTWIAYYWQGEYYPSSRDPCWEVGYCCDGSPSYMLLNLLIEGSRYLVFNRETDDECTTGLANACTCEHEFGIYGTGKVYFEPDDIPRELVCHYHFHALPGNRFDRVKCGIDHQVIKIANKRDKTNCLFYIDNQEF